VAKLKQHGAEAATWVETVHPNLYSRAPQFIMGCFVFAVPVCHAATGKGKRIRADSQL
jgi:hypothetical protein